MRAEYYAVGTVVKPQGIDGQVRVVPSTDDPERFLDLDTVSVESGDGYRSVAIEDVSVRSGFVYARLDGCFDRNQAETQRGWVLHVHRDQAVQLPEDRHFIADLIGCRVVDSRGQEVGVLQDILQPGANDVYVIQLKKGRMLLPALKKVVTHIDIQAQQIIIDENILDEVAVIED